MSASRIAIAAAALVAFVALGLAVSHAAPSGIDLAGAALAGQAPRLALIFTESGTFPVLACIVAASLVLAWRSPRWRTRALTFAVTIPVMWKVSDFCKAAFGRPRPPYWRLIHETSASYPSGHAMWAVLVYWLWAWLVWRSGLPRAVRIVTSTVLALWGCGVIWSRLALGAHYVTDLAGGILLGIVALGVANAVRAAGARRGGSNLVP